MTKKNAKDVRKDLLALIIHQTPSEYKNLAEKFSETANYLGLSPVTINNIFLHASMNVDIDENTNKDSVSEFKPYNILNLYNLEFSGIDYDVKGVSITGKDYSKLSVHFKNKIGKEIYLAWPTAVKLIESMKHVIDEDTQQKMIPETLQGKPVSPEKYESAFSNQKDYAETLEEIIRDETKIKDIQSINEKRKVKSLLGLKEALQEASQGLYRDFSDFVKSKEFFSETAMHYKELLLPKGGIIKRIQGQETLPKEIEKSLVLVTKYKKQLTPNIYAKHMHVLQGWDELTSLMDAPGHLSRYISDLKELAENNEITGRPQFLLKSMQTLHEEKSIMSMPEILPFLMLYNVSQKRTEKAKQELQKSDDYQEDYSNGVKNFQSFFFKENKWAGSKDEAIPKSVSKDLEGLVKKQGDKILRETQKWMRSLYAEKDFESVITTKSFDETRNEIENVVVLERRRKMSEQKKYALISDEQRAVETFKEMYGIELQEFAARIEDQKKYSYKYNLEWEKKQRKIKILGEAKIWEPQDFEMLQDAITNLRDNYVKLTSEIEQDIKKYYELRLKSKITKHEVPELYFSMGELYVKKDVIKIKEIIDMQEPIINETYKKIEIKTKKAIEKNKEYLILKNKEFERTPVTNEYRVTFYGSTFEEKEDFKETFGYMTRKKMDKAWTAHKNKVEIAETLDKIRVYNETHKGKIKIEIR